MNNLSLNSGLMAAFTSVVFAILLWAGFQTIGETGTESDGSSPPLSAVIGHSLHSLFTAFGFSSPPFVASAATSSYGTANRSFMAGVMITYANNSGVPLVKQDVTAC